MNAVVLLCIVLVGAGLIGVGLHYLAEHFGND